VHESRLLGLAGGEDTLCRPMSATRPQTKRDAPAEIEDAVETIGYGKS
jgi:hypothetical protein